MESIRGLKGPCEAALPSLPPPFPALTRGHEVDAEAAGARGQEEGEDVLARVVVELADGLVALLRRHAPREHAVAAEEATAAVAAATASSLRSPPELEVAREQIEHLQGQDRREGGAGALLPSGSRAAAVPQQATHALELAEDEDLVPAPAPPRTPWNWLKMRTLCPSARSRRSILSSTIILPHVETRRASSGSLQRRGWGRSMPSGH